MKLDTIADAIEAFRQGELIVVVDDTDRENEGDLIMAAAHATPEKIGFMIHHTSGILCVPLTMERAERLNLPPMVTNNLDPLRTAFTVSVDYKVGLTTGISAEERSATARALADEDAVASDFVRPGHMFPLISRAGGVLTRSGHTEAGTDFAKLARLPEAGVLAEIVNDDGGVKRFPELFEFARKHGLRIVSIEDLIEYRIRTETFIERVGQWAVTVRGLDAQVYAYRTPFEPMQHLVAVFGDIGDGRRVPCRIHREQPVADLLQRAPGERDWLTGATERFAERRRGVVVLLRNPAAVEATEEAGAGVISGERHATARARMERWRDVGVGAQILRHLGVSSIELVASRAQRFVGLGGFGIEIAETTIADD